MSLDPRQQSVRGQGGSGSPAGRPSFSAASAWDNAIDFLNVFKPRSVIRYYRSEDGNAVFKFAFTPDGDHIAIRCLDRPLLNGMDDSPIHTHLYPSGQICIAIGREPRDQHRAEELARQWAEYFLEYRRTGISQ